MFATPNLFCLRSSCSEVAADKPSSCWRGWLSDGAVIRGRLVNAGKPVPNAEIALIPRT